MEVEFLTERGNVYHLSVHTLIPNTTNVMEVIMKKRNVMNSVVQVTIRHLLMNTNVTKIITQQ